MVTQITSQRAYDADDFYWFCSWLQLPASDKKLYHSAQTLGKELPSFCKYLQTKPLSQLGIHKRLLVIRYSISQIEWVMISNILGSAAINTSRILHSELGYVIYEQYFNEMLGAIARRIEKLHATTSQRQGKALFLLTRWFDTAYKEAERHRRILELLSGYFHHHLRLYQKLNQPWREEHVNPYQQEFNDFFIERHGFWPKLCHIGRNFLSLFNNIEHEQLIGLVNEYRRKVKLTQLAAKLLYRSDWPRNAKLISLIKLNSKLIQPMSLLFTQMRYTQPLIDYVTLMEFIRRAIPNFERKASPKNNRQFRDVADKLDNLRKIITDQSARFNTAGTLANLHGAMPYFHQLANLMQDLTDYLMRALVIDKDVLNHYVNRMLFFINPENDELSETGFAYRLLVSSLCLLSLREVIKHYGTAHIAEDKLKPLLSFVTDQLDATRLVLFNQSKLES